MSEFINYKNNYYIKTNDDKISYLTFIRNCCVLFVQRRYDDLRKYFGTLGLDFNQDGIIGTVHSDVLQKEKEVSYFMFRQDCEIWMNSSMYRHHIDGTKPIPMYKDPFIYVGLSMPILVILTFWIISLFIK